MKLETSWNSCEFYPENDKERNILINLYNSLSDEDKKECKLIVDKKSLSIEGLNIQTYF